MPDMRVPVQRLRQPMAGHEYEALEGNGVITQFYELKSQNKWGLGYYVRGRMSDPDRTIESDCGPDWANEKIMFDLLVARIRYQELCDVAPQSTKRLRGRPVPRGLFPDRPADPDDCGPGNRRESACAPTAT